REHLDDVERLLTAIGLRDEKALGVDADRARVAHIERVLGVDEGGDAASALSLAERVQRERRLAARLRAVDLDDAAPGIAPDAEGIVDGERARGDDGNVALVLVAERHDRSLAELLLDGADDGLDGAQLVRDVQVHDVFSGAPPLARRTSIRSG